MRVLRLEQDRLRKSDLHEVEARKNDLIATLMKNHEKDFREIKNFYNDITQNNLALIQTLKVGATTLGCSPRPAQRICV